MNLINQLLLLSLKINFKLIYLFNKKSPNIFIKVLCLKYILREHNDIQIYMTAKYEEIKNNNLKDIII